MTIAVVKQFKALASVAEKSGLQQELDPKVISLILVEARIFIGNFS